MGVGGIVERLINYLQFTGEGVYKEAWTKMLVFTLRGERVSIRTLFIQVEKFMECPLLVHQRPQETFVQLV